MEKIKLLFEVEVNKDFVASAAGMTIASAGMSVDSNLVIERIESGDPIAIEMPEKEQTMFEFMLGSFVGVDIIGSIEVGGKNV